jgi:hypothetical protein
MSRLDDQSRGGTALTPGFNAMDAVRVAWGAAGLLRTRQAADWYGVPPVVRHRSLALAAIRVLGARDILQATVIPARAEARARRLGAAVDALHVVSMLPLALLSPTWRRPALTSAAVTTVFAAAELGATRRVEPASPRAVEAEDQGEPVVDGTGAEVLPLYTVELAPTPPDPGHLPVEEASRELDRLREEMREPFERKDMEAVRSLARERARVTNQRTRYLLQRGMRRSWRGPTRP